jgi:hypothetical protein
VIFPIEESQKRTKPSYENCMTIEKPVKGTKGRSEISKIIDLPDGLLIDSMHLVYLGILKRLLEKWFDSSNSKKDYYIGNKMKLQIIYLILINTLRST